MNLDQKEQGGEKPAGQSGAPASISVEPAEVKAPDADPANNSIIIPQLDTPVSNGTPARLASVITNVSERAVSAAKKQLARATAEPGTFKNWTRPLHGLALAVQQDGDLKEDFRVLLLAVRNTTSQPLKLIPGTPDLTLEMHDDKGKVINVQSLKPLHTEMSHLGSEVAAGRTIYYALPT